jgi:SPP1 family predicted phage head-tail adaptor
MKIMDLNQRVVLQRRNCVSDEMGGYTEIWETIGELWACMKEYFNPAKLSSVYGAGGDTLHLYSYKMYVRVSMDLNCNMRILWRGEPYKIVSDPIVLSSKDLQEMVIRKEKE